MKKESTIKTEISTEYYLIHRLLELIGHLGIVYSDKKLAVLFKQFDDYVYSSLDLPKNAGDIVDIHMIVEQEKI